MGLFSDIKNDVKKAHAGEINFSAGEEVIYERVVPKRFKTIVTNKRIVQYNMMNGEIKMFNIKRVSKVKQQHGKVEVDGEELFFNNATEAEEFINAIFLNI